MAAAIVTEIWNETTKKFEAMASFGSFDAFYAYVTKFKVATTADRLRVHVPGGFSLSSEQIIKIEALGIERIWKFKLGHYQVYNR